MAEIVESAKAANIHEFIMASSERLEHWPRLLVIDAALLSWLAGWLLAGWLACGRSW